MIRHARLDELDKCKALIIEAISLSARHGDIDDAVVTNTILQCLTSPQMCMFVSVDSSDEIRGVLAGYVAPSVFGSFLVASDFVTYSKDGKGFYLMRRFEKWARQFNSVKQIDFINSFGGGEAAELLAIKMGFERIGGYLSKGV